MDSNELNKVAGAAIGALLVFMLLGFFAGQIYGVGEGGHHGEETLAFALEIEDETEVAEGEDGAAAEEEAIDYAALVQNADASAGAGTFNKCKACHKIEDGANGVGPHLWNVVGREIAAVSEYSYSDALSSKDGVWNLENLLVWLENPANFAEGNKMGYALGGDPQDIMNLIAYINEESGDPADLAALAPEDSGEQAAAEGETEMASAEGESDAGAETAAAEEAAAEAETEAAEAAEPAAEAAANAEASTGDAEAAEAESEAAAESEASAENEASSESEASAENEAAAGSEGGDDSTEMANAAPSGGDAAEAEASAASEGTEVAAAGDGGGQWADLLAEADADAGKKVFNKCRACHQAEQERNGVGPHLVGVVGREIAGVDGFRYSDALSGMDGAWNLDNLMTWLENPANFARGNKMAYPGLKDAQDRINVITYLNEADGSPEPLN